MATSTAGNHRAYGNGVARHDFPVLRQQAPIAYYKHCPLAQPKFFQQLHHGFRPGQNQRFPLRFQRNGNSWGSIGAHLAKYPSCSIFIAEYTKAAYPARMTTGSSCLKLPRGVVSNFRFSASTRSLAYYPQGEHHDSKQSACC